MSWNPIDDSETPNWNSVIPAGNFGAFQVGPFQTNFQQGQSINLWGPIDDSETPNWVPV